MNKLAFICAMAALPVAATADPLVETVTANNPLLEAPSEWIGETPHIVIIGTANGYPFDFQLLDMEAADLHDLEVKREFLLTEAGYGPYREIDFGVKLILDGIEKSIEAKLTHADLNTANVPPPTFALQSEVEYPSGDQIFFEFEFEWENSGVTVNEELAEWTGTAVIELDDGLGAGEPHGDGFVGGFIQAANGDDALTISYTLAVTDYEVED